MAIEYFKKHTCQFCDLATKVANDRQEKFTKLDYKLKNEINFLEAYFN
jgi:hypothetical protein